MARGRPRYGYVSTWCEATLLAIWILLAGAGLVEAQSQRYRIAVLTPGLTFGPALEGFRAGLAQLGYHEGHNLTFMVEDVQGEVASLASRAAKLVEARPDIMVTIGTEATVAATQVTTTLPIVFTFVADPLRSGLIASYTSSQNNVTGISTYAGPLSGKRLEILKEIVPGIKRVLVLVAAQERGAAVSFQALAEMAPKLDIELLRHDVSSREEMERMLETLPRGAVDAISHVPSSLVGTHIDLLIHKAKEEKIPLSVPEYSMVERGALVSYGTDQRLLGIQAAQLVARIIKGARPSDILVETPEPLLLAVNISTARAIGLDVPRSILERTERIVE